MSKISIKPKKRSASYTQRGFLYQDVIMLHYLLTHLYEIKSIYAEDPEDITIYEIKKDHKTKKMEEVVSYVQVKYADDVYSHYRSTALKNAMTTLFEDCKYNSNTKILHLIYVTNSHYPFASQKDLNLEFPPKAFYTHTRFPPEVRIKIKKQAKKVSKSENCTKLLNFFIKKFSLLKYYFEGSNEEETPFNELKKDIWYFISHTGIDLTYASLLRNKWLFMIRESDCNIKNKKIIGYGKNKNHYYPRKISKNNFIASTCVPIMLGFSGINRRKEFAKELNISSNYRHYLHRAFGNISDFFIANFEIRSLIQNAYNMFCNRYYLKYKKVINSNNSKIKFVKDKKYIEDLNDKINKHPDNYTFIVTQYLSWIILNETDRIQGIINYANGTKKKEEPFL